jgi:sortase A
MNSKIKRQRFLSKRTRSFLRWSGHFFSIIGILALSYVGFVLGYTRLYQAYLTRRFEQELKIARLPAGSGKDLPSSPLPPVPSEADRARVERAAPEGSLLGRIEIGTIGLSAMILEGTDGKTLRQAVGHIPGTALPGQQGNIAIAGHRDTFFRGLRNIHLGDEITLTTLHGTYRYRVDSTKVVEPEDIAVLDHSDDAILTLVTCYPFYFVGPAPKRFILRARPPLVSSSDHRGHS